VVKATATIPLKLLRAILPSIIITITLVDPGMRVLYTERVSPAFDVAACFLSRRWSSGKVLQSLFGNR
jgi:hypothetical protein